MDLRLTFVSGRLTGDGIDDIGLFVINGSYDAGKLECWWTKRYPGSHSVIYHGFREGKGIWGTWEIPPLSKGGFHIWPRQAGDGEHAALQAELERPVEVSATTEVELPASPAPR